MGDRQLLAGALRARHPAAIPGEIDLADLETHLDFERLLLGGVPQAGRASQRASASSVRPRPEAKARLAEQHRDIRPS